MAVLARVREDALHAAATKPSPPQPLATVKQLHNQSQFLFLTSTGTATAVFLRQRSNAGGSVHSGVTLSLVAGALSRCTIFWQDASHSCDVSLPVQPHQGRQKLAQTIGACHHDGKGTNRAPFSAPVAGSIVRLACELSNDCPALGPPLGSVLFALKVFLGTGPKPIGFLFVEKYRALRNSCFCMHLFYYSCLKMFDLI